MGRLFELGLCGCGLVWAVAATTLAQRAAHGIAGRFALWSVESLLSSLFLIFLLVFGFQLLDWIATRNAELLDVLPLPTRPGWLEEWGIGASLGWGLCLAVVLPLLLTGNLHGHLSFNIRQVGPMLLAAATLLAVSLAEELLFRGYLLRRLIASVGPSWAAVITSVLFAVVLVWSNTADNRFFALLNAFLFALLLAVSYLRTHALWVAWGLHFSFRAVMLLILGLPAAGHFSGSSAMQMFSTGRAWLSGGLYGVDDAWLTAPMLLLGLVALYRSTREYAWRYTFTAPVAAGYEVVVPPPKQHVAMEQELAKASPLVQIRSTTPRGASTPPPPKPVD